MCTAVRFTDEDGRLFWGRNLDWDEGYGQVPLVMPRGFFVKEAFGEGHPSAHAVIGMGIEHEGYPLYFDCANDAGLAVGGLNFPLSARFEEGPVEGKVNVAAYEMPVWATTNFSTVDEVAAALKDVVLVDRGIAPSLPAARLHWHIADAQRSIVVEYEADGMHVHDDPVDVLTNEPPFPWHRENLRTYRGCGNQWLGAARWGDVSFEPFGAGGAMRGIPGDVSSPSRFVKAAFVNAFHPQKQTEEENVMRMFHTLGSVAFVEGCATTRRGTFDKTLYSSCFSASSGTYYYNAYDDITVRSVRLGDHAGADPSALVAPCA